MSTTAELTGSMLLAAIPGALCIAILAGPRRMIMQVDFALSPLVVLGRIFYACCLWLLPIFAVLNWHFGLLAGTRALIGFPLVFVLAVLPYVFIESQFIRTGPRERTPPTVQVTR